VLRFFVTIIEKFCNAQPERKGDAPDLSEAGRGMDKVTNPDFSSKISTSKSPGTHRQESRFLPRLPRAIFAIGLAWPSTFLPGSAQNIESDVSSRKQSPKKFLPGATTTPSRYTKLCRFRPGKPSRISSPRAKITKHSLLLSPRNFIGLQDRDCRSVRLTVSAQK
jgi:hypothetical protein